MLIALLNKNEGEFDISYDTLIKNKFPIDFTSTTLEGVFPGLTDDIGFDIPLSIRFISRGAPMILFSKDKLEVNLNMTM